MGKPLDKNPARRYQSAGALAGALEDAAAAAASGSLMEADTPRAQAIARIRQALKQGKHVLVEGHTRTGKSHVVSQIAGWEENALTLLSGCKKAALLDLARQLWERGNQLDEDFAYFTEFEDVKRKISRLTVPELAVVVATALTRGACLELAEGKQKPIIVVDQLEAATEKNVRDPGQAIIIDDASERAVVGQVIQNP